MAVNDENSRITLSVFDRLIDLDPTSSAEAESSRSVSLRELKLAVRRDLEWLLNTRCHADDEIDENSELRRSVAFYGLPDILGMSPKNPAEQKRLTKALEAAIKQFEPRFLNPIVTLEPVDPVDRQLKFRIEASLDIDPTPETVVFDTVLQSASGEFSVNSR
ncbi:MAG TPA: type VI secretion system baseplate subunit TssE [Pyrinomonadaceae bacterium]|nr:type VI secretion system baseplate subunit TssE [Pyrinomonadaceae bacterium]